MVRDRAILIDNGDSVELTGDKSQVFGVIANRAYQRLEIIFPPINNKVIKRRLTLSIPILNILQTIEYPLDTPVAMILAPQNVRLHAKLEDLDMSDGLIKIVTAIIFTRPLAFADTASLPILLLGECQVYVKPIKK